MPVAIASRYMVAQLHACQFIEYQGPNWIRLLVRLVVSGGPLCADDNSMFGRLIEFNWQIQTVNKVEASVCEDPHGAHIRKPRNIKRLWPSSTRIQLKIWCAWTGS